MRAEQGIRPYAPEHLAALVGIWDRGWHEAHAGLVPADLTRLRTRASFRDRAVANAPGTRLALTGDELSGFAMVKGDELYQLYVAPQARGQGTAQALIADAEARIRATGHTTAWLACTVGNARAARFYEKSGWINTGVETVNLDTSRGPFPLAVWRFEKALNPER